MASTQRGTLPASRSSAAVERGAGARARREKECVGEFKCWECAFAARTLGGPASHAACLHGDPPHAPGGDRAAWKKKYKDMAAEAARRCAAAGR